MEIKLKNKVFKKYLVFSLTLKVNIKYSKAIKVNIVLFMYT